MHYFDEMRLIIKPINNNIIIDLKYIEIDTITPWNSKNNRSLLIWHNKFKMEKIKR